jgi:hypothetical protein
LFFIINMYFQNFKISIFFLLSFNNSCGFANKLSIAINYYYLKNNLMKKNLNTL